MRINLSEQIVDYLIKALEKLSDRIGEMAVEAEGDPEKEKEVEELYRIHDLLYRLKNDLKSLGID